MSERKFVLFAMAGAAAGILQQPFFAGLLRLPQAFYVIAPGLIFALSITISAISVAHENILRSEIIKRYTLGAAVLAVGMPVALLAGAASLAMIDRMISDGIFQFGGIGLPFFIGEIVSCILWSFVLAIWVAIVNRSQALVVMRVALLVTGSIMVSVNLAEIISKSLWQKSFFVPMISLAEGIGSALVLAIGCSSYFGQRGKSVIQT